MHPLLLIVIQLRARSICPDEHFIQTQKTVVVAASLDAYADAKHQACERSVPASELWMQRRPERIPLGESGRRFLQAFLVVAVDLLERPTMRNHRTHRLASLAIDVDANALKQHVVWVAVHWTMVSLLVGQQNLFIGRACRHVLRQLTN